MLILLRNAEINKKDKNGFNSNGMDEEINYRNEKINYFLVDSVWDKIIETILKQEQERNKRRKTKLKLIDKNINNSKINKNVDLLNHNKNKNKRNKIDNNINNTVYKFSRSSLKKSGEITDLKNINSSETIKHFPSIDTLPTNFTLKNKK